MRLAGLPCLEVYSSGRIKTSQGQTQAGLSVFHLRWRRPTDPSPILHEPLPPHRIAHPPRTAIIDTSTCRETRIVSGWVQSARWSVETLYWEAARSIRL